MIAWLASIALAAPCTAIVGGTVWLDGAPVAGASVVLQGAQVVAVGVAPAGLAGGASPTWQGAPCTKYDATGKVVTAGLIDVATQIGVSEIGLEAATVDANPSVEDPIRAALRVVDAYDPRSVQVAIARRGGVTSVIVAPSGGFVSGVGAWVRLAGATQAEAVVDPDAVMVASLSHAGSKAEGALRLRELFAETRFYQQNTAAWLTNRTRPLAAEALDLQAMIPVVRGELPLVVSADRAADLEMLARMAKQEGVRLVIHGAAEGWLVAEQLAAANIAVVVDPLVYGAGSFDQIYGRPDNAALLVAAGVPVMISTFSGHNARDLRVRAGNAVRGGLSPADALAAITSVPAAVFGADAGVLAPGRVADVVVWTGDPLETSTWAEAVWVGGEPRSLTSRQTELRDRYLAR